MLVEEMRDGLGDLDRDGGGDNERDLERDGDREDDRDGERTCRTRPIGAAGCSTR